MLKRDSSTIYRWLRAYKQDAITSLLTVKKAPGKTPHIPPEVRSSISEREGGFKLKGITINDLAPPPMNSLESLFCESDDLCQNFEPRWHSHLIGRGGKTRRRAKSLCLSDIMTILIAFHQHHYRNFKYY
ncbi:MAG: helix-turn-helix domain-containing protein [Oscillatoriales cyanobacterium]|nr:MAG: helix-turn-helix domain-containing protein [Oscillatoriales cyanobacterium]TAE19066.1 MAG: helix-turn-helix domain-containing protein [Oscillatoriales cyanobacterium]TAE50266.1 MAG: helix-turn-helix domain-containing protein [Oscillatoriales cyanobacterium]